jgi:hypothetical protein
VSEGFRVVRIVLGFLLLTAAMLTIQGLGIDPLSQDSFLASPRLQVAAIEIEILLGLWLLSGLAKRGAWAVAVGFFGILAGISLYQALTGQRSCGCLGAVEVNPWWTFGLDVAGVVALAIFRPARGATSSAVWLMPVAKTALGAAIILAAISGVFLLIHDNPAAALAQLRGEAITVEPYVTDVGAGVAGESRTFSMQLTNHTDHTVRIIGGTTSCNCLATKDLPLDLPPHGSESIRVGMKFRGSPGRFVHRFELYTDHQRQWVVLARFAGRIGESPQP